MLDLSGAVPGPFLGKVGLGDLLVAQGVGLVVGVLTVPFGTPILYAIAVAVGVTAVLLVRVAGRSLVQWASTLGRRMIGADCTIGRTVDYRAPSGRSLGLYWDGTKVVAVVAVLPQRGGLTTITKDAFVSTHRLPISELAQCLSQHDITLDGIDVISHGHRTRSGTPAGGVYEQLIGPLPAVAVRNVWLAVRLDAEKSAAAVARRGGGTEGASRAVTTATQRIVRALDDAGCRSRILTAPEIREAVLKVTAGADPAALRDSWKFARVGSDVNIGSAIDPNRLGSDLLAKLWVTPSRGTTVAVRLRPGSAPGTVAVGAGWRLTSRALGDQVRFRGSVSMNGRHREGLLSHLPIAVSGLDDAIDVAEFPVEDVDRLHLPSSGCGQLIGSDSQGQGVATRVVGSGISTVHVAGELYLAQQLVFRALAVGASVLVRTDRPHAWENLVGAIANPDRLSIAGEPNHSNAGYTATVVDGDVAPAPHAGVTTIYLADHRRGLPDTDADVLIVQPGSSGSVVVLETGSTSVELSLVSIARETAFIGRPRTTHFANQPG
ncbi:type VII secretion protein EccE [Antrihabitans sp. YC3-6]|uniref:Type VII secretion protein EccE n=1 Tax=Antrihabitans stalagmiti TaxID=2799499 RepID=A0A934NNR9_9NOCA|nr:type VII secretion protein EccE [Antrihabitans stalagmiti]MBJ8338616.1 type VII secretion protein EccE [Antrihabitans stalagmiti]